MLVANFILTPFNGQQTIGIMGATAVSKGYLWILVLVPNYKVDFQSWKMSQLPKAVAFLESLIMIWMVQPI